MERRPALNSALKYFIDWHSEQLLLMEIERSLTADEDYRRVVRRQVQTNLVISFLVPGAVLYLMRKESRAVSMLTATFALSVNLINLFLHYEKDRVYRLGLTETTAGEFIRNIYRDRLPHAKQNRHFEAKHRELVAFRTKYLSVSPLTRFEWYLKKYNTKSLE